MKGLISREKAYKVLTEYYHHKHFSQHIALQEALNRVPDAHTIAQCDITRCKFCTYFKSDFWCAWWEGTTSFNDYCSKGERKVTNG